jgi:hypothetical protein
MSSDFLPELATLGPIGIARAKAEASTDRQRCITSGEDSPPAAIGGKLPRPDWIGTFASWQLASKEQMMKQRPRGG